MSMNSEKRQTSLNAEEIKRLILDMPQESRDILVQLISDLRERGTGLSQVIISELAKKYAGDAQRLAGGEDH